MKTAEVKKAEAAASELRHRACAPRRASSRALVVVREPRLHLRTDSRVEGGDLAQQRGKKRKSLATGRI